MMPQTILYIATSLDGFIARPNGSLDWLTSLPKPKSEEDYGYADLLSKIGTIIMGRKTYQEVIKFGIDWPYVGHNAWVVSQNKNLKIQSPDTYVLADNLTSFITNLKAKSEKDIWLVGGGQLITSFLHEELIDQMIITIIPKILGDGIPLFAKKPKETNWTLNQAKTYETGLVTLIYDREL